jgi:threonine/homoserine/homoserine lactone efflux protein
MAMHFFLNGLLLGFAIAAPVGPIGVLCIRRSLTDGQRAGFATGMGAATADAVYGCAAAFGLTMVSDFLVRQRFWLGLIGGIFLCFLGFKTLRTRPAAEPAAANRRGLAGAYFATFALTITNPMTILSFVAVFAGLGLASSSDYAAAASLVLGVSLGSAIWWLLLSSGSALLRRRLQATALLWLNRASGLIILVLGLYALITAMR